MGGVGSQQVDRQRDCVSIVRNTLYVYSVGIN